MKTKIKRVLFNLIVIASFCQTLVGQDLSKLKEEKPFEISGRINLGLSAYQTSREIPQFNPFGYLINASPIVSLYGIDIPLTVIYSERERSFRQPFNRVGASPSYKWIKVHLGQRNVHFNPYTLAGYTFLGYGVELNPGLFKVGFIRGRFNKAVRNVPGIESFIQPSFDRKGWAANIGVGNSTKFLDFSFMRAADEIPTDLSFDNFGNVRPSENLSLGIKGSLDFLKYFSFAFNVAGSIYTEDQTTLSLSELSNDSRIFNLLPQGFFTPRVNTTLKFARDAEIGYSSKVFKLQIAYKRIDPQYRSMGAYRFLTDIEDYTISPSFSLFKQKIRVSGTLGLQRNNISSLKLQTSTRKIGSFNLSYYGKNGLTSNLSYSNFRADVISVDDLILSDSFDIIQVSENLNFRLQIPLDSDKKYSLSFNSGQQRYNRESLLGEELPENISRNGMLMLNRRSGKDGFGYSMGVTGQNLAGFRPQNRIGIRMNIQKKMGKDIKLGLFASGMQNIGGDQINNRILNGGIRGSYRIQQNQSLNLSLRYINNIDLNDSTRVISDLRSQLNYSLRF